MSPSDNLPRRFAKIYTAAITDVMDEMGLRRQTLPSTIQPLADSMRTAGYAFTVRGRSHSGHPRERDQTLRRFLAMLGRLRRTRCWWWPPTTTWRRTSASSARPGSARAACGAR